MFDDITEGLGALERFQPEDQSGHFETIYREVFHYLNSQQELWSRDCLPVRIPATYSTYG